MEDRDQRRFDLSTVGKRLRYIWKRTGLKQNLFAERIGVAVSTLINYTNDTRSPDSEFLIKVAKEFNVNPTWLLVHQGPYELDHPDAVIDPKISWTEPISLEFYDVELREDGTYKILKKSPKESPSTGLKAIPLINLGRDVIIPDWTPPRSELF